MRNIAKLPRELPRSFSAVQMGNIAKLAGELPRSFSAVQAGNIAKRSEELPRSFSVVQMGKLLNFQGNYQAVSLPCKWLDSITQH